MNSCSAIGGKYSRFTAAYTALYFLVATTKILSFWKQGNGSFFDSDLESGKEILTIIGIITLMLCLYNFGKKKRQVLAIVQRSWPLMLLFLFVFSSLFWSQLPSLTIKRYTKLFILLICIIDLISEKDNYRTLKMSLLWYIGAVVGLSYVLVIALPQYGLMIYAQTGKPVAKGIIAHKSELGEFCAASILVLFWIYYSMPVIHKSFMWALWSNGIGALGLLLLTQGKNPLLNLMFSYMIMVIISKIYRVRDKRLQLALVFMSCFLGTVFLYLRTTGVIGSIIEFIVISSGKDMTFTGRTNVWEILYYFGLKKPYLGSGYGAFFGGKETAWLSNYVWGSAASAHSGYLQLFLELGFIGLAAFVMYLIYTLISSFYIKGLFSSSEKAAIITLVLFNVFYNIVSVSFLSYRMSYMELLLVNLYCSSKSLEKKTNEGG